MDGSSLLQRYLQSLLAVFPPRRFGSQRQASPERVGEYRQTQLVYRAVEKSVKQSSWRGGPLYLADVKFDNVTFEFGADPQSQRLLAEIKRHKNEPVSLIVAPAQS
jgi:hypothetical protein